MDYGQEATLLPISFLAWQEMTKLMLGFTGHIPHFTHGRYKKRLALGRGEEHSVESLEKGQFRNPRTLHATADPRITPGSSMSFFARSPIHSPLNPAYKCSPKRGPSTPKWSTESSQLDLAVPQSASGVIMATGNQQPETIKAKILHDVSPICHGFKPTEPQNL